MATVSLPTASALSPSIPPVTDQTLSAIAQLAERAGLAHVHMLAWRDLDDVEAGGSEIHAHNVASIWGLAGLKVTMRTSFAAGRPQRTVRAGYTVIRKAGRYLVFPRSVVSEMTGRLGPCDGLVEIWNGMPFLSPIWWRGPRSIWLHHVHGPMWAMSLPPRLAQMGLLLEERLAPPFYRRSPIVTLSNSSKAEIVNELGMKPERVSVIEPGIDARFSPGGTRSDTPLVVAVGRLVPVKNFSRLIAVMGRVHQRVPAARLVIVGDGYERDNLAAQIHEADADSYIQLAGRIGDDQLIDLYRSAWLIASTSIREGWGMTLTEAAACGTPAVATRIAGHSDAIDEGRSGMTAERDDDLVDLISKVLTDASLREQLQNGALARASRLTWERTATETFSVLAADALRRNGR